MKINKINIRGIKTKNFKLITLTLQQQKVQRQKKLLEILLVDEKQKMFHTVQSRIKRNLVIHLINIFIEAYKRK